jgi:hypothetical protein
MYVCMYICVCVRACVRVCMHVSMYVCFFVPSEIHTQLLHALCEKNVEFFLNLKYGDYVTTRL